MTYQSQNFYAVLMGDLVRSERSPSVKNLHERFNLAIDTSNRRYHKDLASPLTITLGDEFQGLATSLSAILPIARDLRFALMSDDIECRFAFGIVELKTPLNPDKAWNMMGPGLSRTREKLNQKRASSLYRFAVTEDTLVETMLEALGTGLTSIERRWTVQQQSDVIAFLSGSTARDIATRRNVSVHSVYKVRGSGEFDAYVMQWHAVQEALAYIDAGHRMT